MIVIKPDMTVEVTIDPIRDVLDRALGQGVTASNCRTIAGAYMWVDDEGLRKELPFNILASGLYCGSVVVGNVVLMTLAESLEDSDDHEGAAQARARPCPDCHGTGVNTSRVQPIVCADCLATGVDPGQLVR